MFVDVWSRVGMGGVRGDVGGRVETSIVLQ